MITMLLIGYLVLAMLTFTLLDEFHIITRVFLGLLWLPLLIMALVLFWFEAIEDYEEDEEDEV